MITRQTHGLASASASAAALLLCAASAAAQQPAASPVTSPSAAAQADAPSNPNNAPAQRQPTGTNPPRQLQRDAPSAAKPAGYNPSFSPDGQHFVQQDGAKLYQAICQGCHMPQGQGAKGAGFYPALANNARLASSAYPTYVVLAGLRGMPPFAGRLTNQQVAEVVNYVRRNFGNDYQDAVTAEAVKGLRPAQER
jgi:mono/diheme cytochrome c family protein